MTVNTFFGISFGDVYVEPLVDQVYIAKIQGLC